MVVLVLPLVALPLALPADVAPAADASPVLWLLRTLVLMIGLPFLVLSTTGPLLQRWYSWTDDRRSHDPYFLFAASNLGSFGGLLAYPFLDRAAPDRSLQQRWVLVHRLRGLRGTHRGVRDPLVARGWPAAVGASRACR